MSNSDYTVQINSVKIIRILLRCLIVLVIISLYMHCIFCIVLCLSSSQLVFSCKCTFNIFSRTREWGLTRFLFELFCKHFLFVWSPGIYHPFLMTTVPGSSSQILINVFKKKIHSLQISLLKPLQWVSILLSKTILKPLHQLSNTVAPGFFAIAVAL